MSGGAASGAVGGSGSVAAGGAGSDGGVSATGNRAVSASGSGAAASGGCAAEFGRCDPHRGSASSSPSPSCDVRQSYRAAAVHRPIVNQPSPSAMSSDAEQHEQAGREIADRLLRESRPQPATDGDGDRVGGDHPRGRSEPRPERLLAGGEGDGGEHRLVAELGQEERRPDGEDDGTRRSRRLGRPRLRRACRRGASRRRTRRTPSRRRSRWRRSAARRRSSRRGRPTRGGRAASRG